MRRADIPRFLGEEAVYSFDDDNISAISQHTLEEMTRHGIKHPVRRKLSSESSQSTLSLQQQQQQQATATPLLLQVERRITVEEERDGIVWFTPSTRFQISHRPMDDTFWKEREKIAPSTARNPYEQVEHENVFCNHLLLTNVVNVVFALYLYKWSNQQIYLVLCTLDQWSSHNDWNHYGSVYHGADGRYSKTMVDWSLMTGDDGTGDRAK